MLNINSSYRNIQAQPSIGFKGLSDENKSQVTTSADEKSQTKLSTKGKVILGTTLTGLAALGIYLATRGKAKLSTIHTPSEPIPNPTEILENSLDKFRELGGKLVKGKAIDKDGNLFTGTLVKETPSGATVTLKYENGLLKESKITDGENVKSVKNYTYLDNGKISEIRDMNQSLIMKRYCLPNHPEKVKLFHDNERVIITKDNNGKVNISRTTPKNSTQNINNANSNSEPVTYNGRRVVIDPNPQVYEKADIMGVQTPMREFSPHNYQQGDIPSINIVTRTPNVDYGAWDIIDGKTVASTTAEYHKPFEKLNMWENGEPTLVIGKNENGDKMVWLTAPTGRSDFCGGSTAGRPIRAMYVLTAPNGSDFTKVQLDLVKGMYNRTPEFIKAELPLARSGKVINPCTRNDDMVFDLETLLREVHHYSEGQNISNELAKKLEKVNSLNANEYIQLF